MSRRHHGEISALNIDTTAMRRLRDHLLAPGPPVLADARPVAEPSDAVRNRVRPFAEVMYLVVTADDHIAEPEITALVSALEILTAGQLSRTELASMVDDFVGSIPPGAAEARLARLGAQLGADREDREMAFTLAAVMALADDRVVEHEDQVLDWARQAFGIGARRAGELLGEVS